MHHVNPSRSSYLILPLFPFVLKVLSSLIYHLAPNPHSHMETVSSSSTNKLKTNWAFHSIQKSLLVAAIYARPQTHTPIHSFSITLKQQQQPFIKVKKIRFIRRRKCSHCILMNMLGRTKPHIYLYVYMYIIIYWKSSSLFGLRDHFIWKKVGSILIYHDYYYYYNFYHSPWISMFINWTIIK